MNEGSGSTGCCLISSWRCPPGAREAKRLVALGALVPRSSGLSPALRSCCRGHLISSAGVAGGGGAGGVNAWTRGAGAGAEERDWKICVKPPSADAESEAPEEKPFMRGEPGAASGAGDGSGMDLANGAGGRSAGFPAPDFTKIRVNSPGADEVADEGAGFGSTDGVGAWIGAWIGGVWTGGVWAGTARAV